MTHGPQSNLEVAQNRLKEFMAAHNATFRECAQILGITKQKELMRLMKMKKGSSMYQEQVIANLGDRGVDEAVKKLQKMRSKAMGSQLPRTCAGQAPAAKVQQSGAETEEGESINAPFALGREVCDQCLEQIK